MQWGIEKQGWDSILVNMFTEIGDLYVFICSCILKVLVRINASIVEKNRSIAEKINRCKFEQNPIKAYDLHAMAFYTE